MSNESQKGTIDRFRDENPAKDFDQPRPRDPSENKRPEQIEFLFDAERPGDRHRAVALVEGVVIVAHIKEGCPTAGEWTSEAVKNPHDVKDRKEAERTAGIELAKTDSPGLIHFFQQQPGDQQAA